MEIKPDNKCLICKGSGYMDDNGRKISCICLLKQRVINYLTPTYANVPYSNLIDFSGWGKSMCFSMCSRDYFKSLVKSMLLGYNMKLNFKSVTSFDIMQSFFEDSVYQDFKLLNTIDFLIVYFGNDPPNKLYGETLSSIFDRRILDNRLTWIYCQNSYQSVRFSNKYSEFLSKFIISNFHSTEGTQDISFEKGNKR